MELRSLSRILRTCVVTLCVGGALSAVGCATAPKELVLARVDGRPIVEGDMRYALTVAHRRDSLAGKNTSLDIRQYLGKLIDDRLITDEATRMGMNDYPEVKGAVDAFILRESVVRLHDEEVVSRITVGEEEVRAEFQKNYLQLGILELASQADAERVAAVLASGMPFREIADKEMKTPRGQSGGEYIVHRQSIDSALLAAYETLSPGQNSPPVPLKEKYYIVRRLLPEEMKLDGFAARRDALASDMRKQRQKAAEEVYLRELRSKARIRIDKELLAAMDAGPQPAEKVVAEVDGTTITAGELVEAAEKNVPQGRKQTRSNEEILQSMIDFKVVNNAALSRHYDATTDLKAEVDRYRSYLLKNLFFKKIIGPQIPMDDSKLQEFYSTHLDRFSRPATYRIQQIVLKTEREAQEVLQSLREGTDFLWLARTKLGEDEDMRNVDLGWQTIGEVAEPYRKMVEGMKSGDISTVIKADDKFSVIRLQGKKDAVVELFESVRTEVAKAYFGEEFKQRLQEYVDALKSDATIEILAEALEAYEQRLSR